MSVDDRLREAFGETDRSWDEQVPDALAAVTARRRHESVVRRGAAAALVAAAAVAVAVVAAPDDGRESPTPPLTTPSPSVDVGTPNGPLEGTWTSGSITAEDVRAAARDAGRPGVAAAMLDVLPPRPFRIVLLVTGTGLNQRFRSGRGRDLGLRRRNDRDRGLTHLPAAAQRTRRRERALVGAGGRRAAAGVRVDHRGGHRRGTRRGVATTAVRHVGFHEGLVTARGRWRCHGMGCTRGWVPKTTSSPNAEPRPLPSMPTVSSFGLPTPSSRPLNRTPVPSGNQAGSAA